MTTECEAKQHLIEKRTEELRRELDAGIQALQSDVAERAKGIDPDIDTSGIDVWFNADIEVEWKETRFSLHLPDITVRDKRMSLDLPQFRMVDKDIIFHTPSVRMERRKTGEYPEFFCDRGFIPKCTVRWSPIYIDVPVPFMQEQRIVIKVPEVWVDTVEFIMGIPEFSMRRHDIIMNLPHVTVRQIRVEAAEARARGEALRAETEARSETLMNGFRENAKVELGVLLADVFDCYREQLSQSRTHALATYDGQVAAQEATLASLAAAKVPPNHPNVLQVQAALDAALEHRTAFLSLMDEKLAELETSQRTAVDRLMASFS